MDKFRPRLRLIFFFSAAAASLAFLAIYLSSRPPLPSPKQERRIVSCVAMSYAERLRMGEIKHMASPNVGGMGMYHYKVTYRSPPFPDKEELVHPTVTLWTPHGRLMGSDRGEFGGELVLRRESGGEESYEYLFAANIEDLFITPHGIIATTGYRHMDFDFGTLLQVDFSPEGMPSVREIHQLAGAVRSSWMTVDDRLLVNTGKGSFLLVEPEILIPVRCKRHWWQRRWDPSEARSSMQ